MTNEIRHYCNFCKKKRFERFMKKMHFQTRYQKDVYVCNDNEQFCEKRVRRY